jgi:hypothetical protein
LSNHQFGKLLNNESEITSNFFKYAKINGPNQGIWHFICRGKNKFSGRSLLYKSWQASVGKLL